MDVTKSIKRFWSGGGGGGGGGRGGGREVAKWFEIEPSIEAIGIRISHGDM